MTIAILVLAVAILAVNGCRIARTLDQLEAERLARRRRRRAIARWRPHA